MLRIGVREQLKSPHPSWIPEIIIRPSNYAEKLHKCCQDLQPSRPPDVCCDREKHSRSFHHRLPALLCFENHKRTTWYLNLNPCAHTVPGAQHTALLFTEATDTGEVLSSANALNTQNSPFPLLLSLWALQVWGRSSSDCSSGSTALLLQWLIPNQPCQHHPAPYKPHANTVPLLR